MDNFNYLTAFSVNKLLERLELIINSVISVISRIPLHLLLIYQICSNWMLGEKKKKKPHSLCLPQVLHKPATIVTA